MPNKKITLVALSTAAVIGGFFPTLHRKRAYRYTCIRSFFRGVV